MTSSRKRTPTERYNRVVRFIETHIRIPEGALVGQPMKLEPFQKRFLKAIYANKHITRRAYLSVARKNGKTGLLAAILLVHLVGPEARRNQQLVSGARSRDQAALLWSLAAKMVELSPELSEVVHAIPSGKRLIGLPLNTEYKALASDGAKNMGLSPALAILDEVGAIVGPTDYFTDSITSAQGAHADPLLIAISTQAAGDGDMFSIWLDHAESGDDPQTVAHIYKADQDAGLLDKKQWKKANPALGKFLNEDFLAGEMKRAAKLPTEESKARNLYLNNRISREVLAFSPDVWKKGRGEVDMGVFQRNPVVMGLDLASKVDLCAAVLAAEEDGIVHVHPLVWCPTVGIRERGLRDRAPFDVWCDQGYMIPIGGNTMDFDQIADSIRDFLQKEEISVTSVQYDKHMIQFFEAACERESVLQEAEWVGVSQSFRDMGVRYASLVSLMMDEKIRHNSHPLLNYGASNAVAVMGREGMASLDKKMSTARIDMIVAMVMATWSFGDGRSDFDSFDAEAMIG